MVNHCGLLSEIEAGDLDQPESGKRFPGLPAVELVRERMEDLRQHHIRQQQGRAAEKGVQMARLEVGRLGP
jgi:hypothetical protein